MISFSSLCVLPLALALDFLLGEAPNSCHPVCLAAKWAGWMERFWKRRLGKTFCAGMWAALGTLVPAAAAAWGTAALARCGGAMSAADLTAAVWVYLCLSPRSLAEHAGRVLRAACGGNTEEARGAVSMIVGRDTGGLDLAGVLRAAIESVAENWTDGVLATLFWAAAGWTLGGAEGCAAAAVLHRAANTLDALWGKRNAEYLHFGAFAAHADDVLNWLPARFSLPLASLAAFLMPGLRGAGALRIGWKYRRAHASPNSAWSEAAFAGALNLQIGGAVAYGGVKADYSWIGEGTREASPRHLKLAVRLMLVGTLLAAALFSAAFSWSPLWA